MAIRKMVENKEIKNQSPVDERAVGKPRKSKTKADLSLANDHNREGADPVNPAGPKHTSTDRASRSPHISTVTDGEAG